MPDQLAHSSHMSGNNYLGGHETSGLARRHDLMEEYDSFACALRNLVSDLRFGVSAVFSRQP